MIIVNGLFDYHPMPEFGRDATIFLRVWEFPDGSNLVIASEVKENKGTSVTNGAEYWATEVCREYALDPEETTFIEHYKHDDGSETYDAIMFQWSDEGRAFAPVWTSMRKDEVARFLGAKL